MKLEIQLLLLIGVLLTPFAVADDEVKQIEHCIARADIVLIVDKSGSINAENFAQIHAFIKWLARLIHISENGNHIGVVSFGEKSEANIGLKDYYDAEKFAGDVESKVERDSEDQKTNHYAGFKAANDMLTGSNARADAKKLIIFLTDGANNEAPIRDGKQDIDAANKLVTSMKKDQPLLDIFVIKAEQKFERERNNPTSKSYATEPNLAKYIKSFGDITNEEFLDGLSFLFCKLVTLKLNVDASVLENKGTGYEVFDIEDFDLTKPIYTLINVPNTVIPFEVKSTTGKILVNGDLDFEVTKYYWFQIKLTDGEDSEFSETINATITVLDVNDNSPKFSMDSYEVNIYESQAFNPASFVSTVLATDLDSGMFGTITYSIVSGNNHEGAKKFEINDGKNGEVYLVGQVNKKAKSKYTMIIKAEDGGGNSAEVTLTVNILTLNKHKPKFQDTPYVFNIKENVVNPSVTVKATDDDTSDDITYTIEIQSMFEIDSTTGKITFKSGKSGDYEKLNVKSFTFKVYAKSNDDQVETGVTINIKDVNDVKPTITTVSRSISIPETSAKGYSIVKFTGEDGDGTAPNNDFGYSLQSGQGNRFMITSDGELKVDKNNLAVGTYTITVIITDKGTPSLSNRITYTITVTDVNSPPKLVKKEMTGSVIDGTAANTKLFQVDATDDDGDELTYKVMDANSQFYFLSDTNLLARKEEVEADPNFAAYDLINIKVTDTKGLSTTGTIKLTIVDINDRAPIFDNGAKVITLTENQYTNYRVSGYRATDMDRDAPNNQFTYSVSGDTGSLFTINQSGELKLTGILDHETKQSYKLVIKATDKGSVNKLVGSFEVTVKVGDANDNTPQFGVRSYSGNVDENSDAGTMIRQGTSTTGNAYITVKASDSDGSSPNNQVTYFITGGQTKEEFAIDSMTGKITVSGSLDREYKSSYNLTVTAKDGDSTTTNRNEASTQVRITINDLNDNKPKITSDNTINLFENQKLMSFHTLTGTDADDGDNGMITYSITSGNIGSVFSIVDDKLTLVKELDYDEGTRIFTLKIRATDKGNPSMYSEQTFTVYVLDVNDNAPIFSSNPYSKTVSENLDVNSPVITILATDKDSTNNGMIEYTIESANAKFKIDSQSGKVTLKSKLNFEEKEKHTFYVIAKDKGNPVQSSRVLVTINVDNENEHSPKISNVPANLNIDENSVADVPIVTITATDGDNDVLIYSIDGTSQFFKISQNDGKISTTSNPIDYESDQSFTLPIKVSDGTNFATISVTIKVNDLNEYAPVFNPATYVKTISENVQSGFAVISVTATDEDEPTRSNPVDYEIIQQTSCETNAFEISKDNGKINTSGSLVPSTCTLKVKATDKAPARLVRMSKTVDVIITVIANVKPDLGQDMVTYVNENLATGTVTTITAVDNDGPKDEVEYSIESGNDGSFFKINKKSGVVTILKATDFETNPIYELTIRASDGKSYSEKKLTININDLNEAPEFEKQTYTSSINEKAPVGTGVTQAPAVDQDKKETPNSQLKYSITSGNDDQLFSIDGMGNIITAKLLPAFKPNQKYTLKIKVVDGGTPALMDTATVIIGVQNENDAPVIKTPIDVCVKEEQEPIYDVVKVIATDADSDTLTYSLEGTALFTIDQDGQIKGTSKLDRDITGDRTYTFQVKVYDGSVTVSADVKVCLTDINDNKPQITSAGSVDVMEGYDTNKQIFKFTASDSDSGMNAETKFSIVDGNEDNTFKLTPEGQLSFLIKPDYETKKEYELTIKVEDKGTPTLMTTKKFIVKIEDVNDNDPTFEQDPYQTTISEDHTKDTSVIQVKATDADSNTNGMIEYSIELATDGSNDKFYIKSDGLILLKEKVDYEKQKIYTFYVVATDKGSPKRSKKVKVTINISNKNEHAPKLQNVNGIFIEEEKVKGSVVTTIGAVDADGDKLTFSINDPTGTFIIDENSGEITTVRPIDFEKFKGFPVKVTVTDGQFSDSVTFVISVTNINDNYPIFSKTSYSKTISENNDVGYSVITVTATDEDDKDNLNPVKYMIVENCNYNSNGIDDYSINENTGEIKVNDKLDASQDDECILTIKATDKTPGNDDDRKSATVKVTITIVSNVAPDIGADMTVSINENVATGQVTKITATDPDGKPGDKLKYSIVGGSSFFEIDQSTGDVTILKATNFEVTPSYSLTIRATDVQGAYSDKKLIIKINDVNEAPVFAEDSRTVSVSENVAVEYTIDTFTATDVDAADVNKLVYTITAGNMNTFGINSETGELFNKVLLDYESSLKTYTLTITVTDNGQLTDTMEVIVNIIDVNEQPNITSNPIDICVDEEITPLSTIIATIQASDPESNTLTYTTNSDVFEINNIGEIRNKARLDREVKGNYEFTVTVSDGTSSVSQTVKICLNDINDNTPQIAPVDDVEILVGSVENTPIATIVATDKDINDNKKVMYTITSGNVNDAFKIDMTSGEVKLNKDMTTRMPPVYTLTVTATDKGTPSRSSPITFKVTIKAKPVIGCNCELPEEALPCLQWTKYEIIKGFTGNCYVDKLKKAIIAIQEKIKKLGELRTKFMTCSSNLRSFILSPANADKADDYFDRLDKCSVNMKCKIDHWKMMLTQKEENLKMELKNEEEGWSSYDLPGYGFFNYMKKAVSESQSSRMW